MMNKSTVKTYQNRQIGRLLTKSDEAHYLCGARSSGPTQLPFELAKEIVSCGFLDHTPSEASKETVFACAIFPRERFVRMGGLPCGQRHRARRIAARTNSEKPKPLGSVGRCSTPGSVSVA
jgi:hypothetical protein